MKLIYVTEKLNVNVVIDFILFVMHWQVSGGKQKSHCNIEIITYSYIFLSELVKEMRRQKAKRYGYIFRITCGMLTVIQKYL